ncbi:unnamed protein product [Rotaria sp. Silwood2]|nr:unnamed protein product [Rotaria sp. Silwood2]CAF3477751.1 unnamed protein product [Rotaria sp. Silwood2]CAF4172867.1 unnamed protein product [Rotaria sp. Silwood2]CAF4381697.1 unnamed protein product [Rotaria sp. Silwood2]
MGTPGDDGMDINPNHHNQNDQINQAQLEHGNTTNKEDNLEGYQYVSRQNRKRRNQVNDVDPSTGSTHTPKRRNLEQVNNLSREKPNILSTTKIVSSYFNNSRNSNKQNYESTVHKQIYESSNRKQHQHDSFPPFRITIKDDQYPTQDVAIIKDMNRKCKLNLTYGRMSSSKSNRCYLLYCNTSVQFEHLLDKAKWPDKICDLEYTFEIPKRIPSSYSVVMLNIPTQWDIQYFCNELKVQYKTIIRCERLYVRGERPISKIRIDFSSNKELSDILKCKRMLLDDGNTSYPIEQYVPPLRVLRCYICQQYDDHVAARCPNKDKPICFKCGQQHEYNPDCQNGICCAHCKGNHMAGSPNCPTKIESRELKKLQSKQSSPSSMYLSNNNRWTGDSALQLFRNTTTTIPILTNSCTNDNNHQMKLLDTIHLNIQSIMKQQVDLNNNLKELTSQLNSQAKEIVSINQVLNDIVCPLLKEVIQIIYSQTNSQQKRQIDSSYNKLVKYLNQKDSNYSLSSTIHTNNSPQHQHQQTNLNDMTPSNDNYTNKNNESVC